MKRLFDILVSSLLLVLVTPLFLFVAIAIKLDTPGSVFYRQERIGLAGRTFRIWKFRTMVQNADKIGPYFTAPGDSRITRVGRWLRRTSIDELPQLINVLAGEMSLVGPRPDVPDSRPQYTETEWKRRHTVRPGITGLAQSTVRSDASPGERKRLDLEYVERAGLWLDLQILARTAVQLVRNGGY